MQSSWKDSIYLQREQLASILREPLARLAGKCIPAWDDRERLNDVLLDGFAGIPHCTYLYCVGTDRVQICDNVSESGLVPMHFGRDRSHRPYMIEPVPSWGFLLSDAYISLGGHRPSLTALQTVSADSRLMGFLGADFDLRNLPVTAEHYRESSDWRQVKGDPVIRESVMRQCRVESPMDKHLEQALSILEELMAETRAVNGKFLNDLIAQIKRSRFHRLIDAMQQAPDDESEVGAMPDPADEEDNNDLRVKDEF